MNVEIKLKSVFLLANQFNRMPELSFDDDAIYNTTADIEINHEIFPKQQKIGVIFSYGIKIPADKEEGFFQIDYSSIHFAELEINNYSETEEQKQYIDRFININVAAMIFPFIREHLANTTMKAGMSPLIIPSINFVERYDDKNSTE